MTKKFLTPLAPPALGSDPSVGVSGAIYFNTNSNVLKYYNGSEWRSFGGTTGTGVEVRSNYTNSPEDGNLVFNTSTNSFAIAYDKVWREISFRSETDSPIDGGDSSTVSWDLVLDGGESSDNTFLNAYY
jgi:hypothetical protein